ncbi:MAG: S8 family serine peptidase [Flavobacteriales bacterium]
MLRSIVPLLLGGLMLPSFAFAQYAEKMGFPLKAFLKQQHAPDAEVDLFVRGPRDAAAAAVLLHGGRVKMSRDGVVSARVPVARVHALAQEQAVHFFEFSLDRGQTLNDSMRVKSRVNEVHRGDAPLIQGFTGEGVVLGIIDSGLDHQHPDYQNANGTTRILKYWDQTLGNHPTRTPEPYGYGQVWTAEDINNGVMTSIDQNGYNGHGTSVAGIMGGNGLANGRHKGVAPDGEYIVVSSRFNAPNWRSVVADGVKYIFDEAAALGRPAVINASLGTYFGSHDGLDAAALFIDDLLLAQGGRVMVCAAGNSNDLAPYHLRTFVDADTSWTWFRRNANSALGYPAVFFDLWADAADFQNVQFAIGADRPAPLRFRGRTPFRTITEVVGTVVSDTLWSFSGNRIGVVDYYAVQRGDQYQMQVHMREPDSTNYRFRFMTTGSGMFDVWSSASLGYSSMDAVAPNTSTLPAAVHYVLPDRDQHIVDSWACSPHVITVANYQNETDYVDYLGNPQSVPGREDSIASPSSAGPARTGGIKPDIAAPGSIIFTGPSLPILQASIANNGIAVDAGGWHVRGGGTSAASPVVAGTAALYLQKCPWASAAEVKNALLTTARTDTFTGNVPNNRWGVGKLDAFGALVASGPNPSLELLGSNPFCAGTEVQVTTTEVMNSYTWSTGSSAGVIAVDTTLGVSVEVSNASGCIGRSDTLMLEVLPMVPAPGITESEGLLTSTPADGFQWLLNGVPIDGATDQTHWAVTGGWYQVQVFDANGCSSVSDSLQVIITSVAEVARGELRVWPNSVRSELFVEVPGEDGPMVLEVLDGVGRVVLRQRMARSGVHVVNVSALAPGGYVLRAASGQWPTARFNKL